METGFPVRVGEAAVGEKAWGAGVVRGRAGPEDPVAALDKESLTRADEWILARLDAAIAECDRALGPLWPSTRHDSADARVWREYVSE